MTAGNHEATVEDEIADLRMAAPHLVLLGAGASRAALPNGDANGRILPVMADFGDHVPVGGILDEVGVTHTNFEDAYTAVALDENLADARARLDKAVWDYFAALQLPATPTLYDHLILSLRPKDIIATFNWDPFLYQAARRNAAQTGGIPQILFLHGNVLAGYCQQHDIHGYLGTACSKCSQPFESGPLLYPVAEKNYSGHRMIARAWEHLRWGLEHCFMFTIFGYGAPTSDADAMSILKEAWGGFQKRKMEQVEFIDIRPEDELLPSWEEFIHTHHYDVHSVFYESWIGNHPRRTGEAYLNQFYDAKFISNNPIPKGLDFDDLWTWYGPLLEREKQEPAD